MVLSTSEKLTTLATSACVIRRTNSTMVRSVVALSVCDVTDAKAGDIVAVVDDTGNFVGQALYSELSEIALRFLTTREETIDGEWWRKRLRNCAERRQAIARETDAYRLVYSEGDLMPSLIVDVYDQVFVMQTLSKGTERLQSTLVDLLVEEFKPRAIVERNDARVREFEGLELRTGVLYERVSEPGADRGPQAGSPLGGADAAGSDYAASKSEDPVATARGSVTCDCIEINQHDIRFLGSPLSAQNTGPFIDPRA